MQIIKESEPGAASKARCDGPQRLDLSGFPVGFWETDTEGRVVSVNDELRAALATGRDDIVGRDVRTFVVGSVSGDDAESIHAPSRCFRALLSLKREDGTHLSCAAAVRPLFEDGRPVGSQALILPIDLPRFPGERAAPGDSNPIVEQMLQLLAELCQLYQRLDEQQAALEGRNPRLARVSSVPSVSQLTARERAVVRELSAGHAIKAVAARLGISAHTTRNHLKSVFRKLNVRSQVELLAKIRGVRV